ncbi:MAG: hypothetical protein EP302_02675 [Bacteroidetes bacterium]|jgi:hypothetical protein|nr:MAG: hypothetical protein EP302_02675 [Bacteroidota bacterium]UCE69346.1 MAG: hypothetical protein JSW57_00005 [Flavobacteriaceae bacterium]
MKLRTISLLVISLATWHAGAQDCALGMGGTDPRQIAELFQLEGWQQERMHHWAETLESENAPLQQKLDSLLESHPQETPEQLTALGQQFEAIKEQMVQNSLRYDRLLLGILRPGQYRKYEAFCREVNRMPLEPTSEVFLQYDEN